jgi:CIC family chloride channel protein
MLLFPGAHVHPAAFALVGMGTFYGGIAHAPLSALILVSELAGSYDLLVPMMLATGIGFVALRRWSLYSAQLANKSVSPAHRAEGADSIVAGLLAARRARDVAVPSEISAFFEGVALEEVSRASVALERQKVCVAIDRHGDPRGLVELSLVTELGPDERSWTRLVDAMVPFVGLPPEATLRDAADLLARAGLPQVPIIEGERIVGWVGERELARAFLAGEDRERELASP